MGNFQLKSLIDVATKRKGKNIEFDVVESVNEGCIEWKKHVRKAKPISKKLQKEIDAWMKKYSNPKGDIKRMGSDLENIKMNSWFTKGSVDMSNYKELGEKLIKMMKSKYKVVRVDDYANSKSVVFRKDKKDARTEFDINYAKTIAGPYIAYEGLYGE